ncbi:MAG: DNA repair protein RecN, partial [Pseudomonadota bacterium]|nr:DNA repair protein RecN [Pseudomonadota bacterium]
RLARLGQTLQVLVVTHSPQVAAKGDHHWQVIKDERSEGMATHIARLAEPERRHEIARMLSGAHITDEALAAASRLLHKDENNHK